MKWQGRRQSTNIEDRRSRGGGTMRGGVRGGARIGGLGVVLLLVVGYFLGVDVTPLLQDQGTTTATVPAEMTEADRQAGAFVAVTLADTETVWAQVFRDQVGRDYVPATLVLFKGVTSSPCGGATGATGPFYCPRDQKAYLDTDFFATLAGQLGAQGDFAAAYVVAHEIAHHVQNRLGFLEQANAVRQRSNESQSNRVSVMVELQADCFSGIWARFAHQELGTIEEGDLEEAVNAARRIGDDTLQRNAGRVPQPHTFTHGTSAQRAVWFARGFRSGQIADCNTFADPNL